jgi:oligoendopeptidase F
MSRGGRNRGGPAATAPPAWDLSGYFPAFDGTAFRTFRDLLTADVARLAERAEALGAFGPSTADRWESWILDLEDAAARAEHLRSYLECLESADAGDEAYRAAGAAQALLDAGLEKAESVFVQAIRNTPGRVFAGFLRRKRLEPVAHHLRRLRAMAPFTMGSAEEGLAADLGVDGIHAWGRLYDRIAGQLTFHMAHPGGRGERLPMSRWRALLAHPDPAVRRAAFEGGTRAWASVEEVCAAALNAMAGARLTLYRRRGIAGVLDPALRRMGIRKESLEAMYTAIHAHLDLPRRIFRTKAAFWGGDGIGFYEREAGLPSGGSAAIGWEEAVHMASRAFEAAYPALARHLRLMVERRWVDAAPRPGKRPGAFCTDSPVTEEQRIFMTFEGGLNDVTTLAHEAGHAWHSRLLKGRRPFARRYPMTLAETASIFAEQILAQGIYADAAVAEDEKRRMLDAEVCGAAVLLLDITVRFEFERDFLAERAEGEVGVSRLKALMADTQQRIFGPALRSDGADPLFWASKLHFYISDLTFYNFPYTFGFLLARRLVDRFRREGASFLKRYEAFLAASGEAPVESVAAGTLGVDLTDPGFWESAILGLEPVFSRYRDALEGWQGLPSGGTAAP